MQIGDGEHRALIYKELGIKEIPAYVVPRINNDIERRLLRQTMNKLRGEHEIKLDADEMALIFQDNKLDDLASLIAQQRESLENILTKHKGIQFQHEDNFDVDKALEDLVPETQLGDIWQLGQHRIICADNSDPRSMDRLIEDNKIAQLNTDPPYGVLYGEKNEYMNERYGYCANRITDVYDNDETDTDYTEIFNNIFITLKDKWTEHNTIYIWCSHKMLLQILKSFTDSDVYLSQVLVWVKNSVIPTRTDYYFRNEFCIYGWHKKHKIYFIRGGDRTTVLEYDRPLKNNQHPTMKPIEMISQVIKDGTQEGDIVLDTFLGSGSTLIACEQTNRICFGVEIDPRYCDVAVRRWETFTNKKAVKVVNN